MMQNPLFRATGMMKTAPFTQTEPSQAHLLNSVERIEAELISVARQTNAAVSNFDPAELITATREIDPKFVPPNNQNPLDATELSILCRCIIRNILIPRGLAININQDENGWRSQRGEIEANSWTAMPCLPGKPIYVASMTLNDGGEINSGFCIADVALVDFSALTRCANSRIEIFKLCFAGSTFIRGKEVESTIPYLKKVIADYKIPFEQFANSVLVPLTYWEEIQHARDGVRAAAILEKSPITLHPATVIETLVKKGSLAHDIILNPEFNAVQLHLLTELSGRLASTIQLMDCLYKCNKKELAVLAAISLFATNEITEGTFQQAGQPSIYNYDQIGPLLRQALVQATSLSKQRLFERAFKLDVPAKRAQFLREQLALTLRSQFIPD